MRCLAIALGGWGLALLLCCPANARTSLIGYGGNCVAYAREVTGINLDGNAAAWWPHAEGHYERGHTPQAGSILVFKPSGYMHVGHVAVVSKVIGQREILVDQANWVRGRVTKSMAVFDASPRNDWTAVRVQFGGNWGTRENPTYGFIYQHTVPASFGPSFAEEGHERHQPVASSAEEGREHRAGHITLHATTPDVHQHHGHELAHVGHPGGAKVKHAHLAEEHPTHHPHKGPNTRLAAVY